MSCKTILFQGDSITDARRDKEGGNFYMGSGYPMLVKASLGFDNPDEYLFYNRGISGNRVLDLYARIVKDIINLKPDYMSILIGINDVWHAFKKEPNGTGTKRFEKVYNILIEEIKEELPDTKIMILEPFVLEGTATTATEETPDRFDLFKSGTAKMAEIAKNVAEKHGLLFVPLQQKIEELATKMPACEILYDGVHPTAVGHELIKRAWLEGFEKIK